MLSFDSISAQTMESVSPSESSYDMKQAENQHKPPVGLPDEIIAWTVSTLEPWPPGRYKSLQEAMIDNEVFIPLTFRGGKFPSYKYSLNLDTVNLFSAHPSPFAYHSKKLDNVFRWYLFKKEFEDLAYKSVMLKDPRNFRYTIKRAQVKKIAKPTTIEVKKDSVKVVVAPTIAVPTTADNVIKFIPDRRYWKSSLSLDLKFNQGKSSKNWSGGQIDNLNFISNLVFNYNYSRGKLSIDNNLNIQLNLQNAPKDTLRSYAVTTDLIKYTGLFKLAAAGKWSYSFNPVFNSSLTRRYKANTMTKSSSFLTPYTTSAGLGMTYTVSPKFKNPNRALTINATINALNWNFVYGRDKELFYQLYPKITRTYGSNINIYANPIKFSKSVSGWSRLVYDTNYEYVLITSETQMNIVLTRYFTALITLNLKYDDRMKLTEEIKSRLQVNETLSFGFRYAW
jgi:hypothetical protein